jgi:hypothetical protein
MPSFFSQLAHSNLSHPLFRNPDRIPDCPKRRARFPCPRNRPVTSDSARNLLLQPRDHCALEACALFRACGSPGTRLFLLAYVRGIRKRRPTQAMQPSQHRASARSELLRDLRSRKTLRFQPPQPLIPLQRPKAPRYPPHLSHAPPSSEAPILAIPAAHATTKHLTSNHHDNDGSTPPFHRTAGQRLPVSVRRTPPWAAPRQQTLAGILRRAPSCQERL